MSCAASSVRGETVYQLPNLQSSQVLIYLRKSRADDPSLSVEEVLSKHEQMLNEWAARSLPEPHVVPEENRYREVVSGETIDSRPKMQELLRRIESPSIRAVLVVEPQRLSRGDLEDIGRIVKILRYTNTLVITLQYSYDMHDAHDRDAFERELKRGNEFLEYQKRIMNNGRILSVKNGNYIGNVPPYGYRKVRMKDGKRYAYTLEPDPIEAPILKAIFTWYADGIGTTHICDKLEEMGVKPRKAKAWSPYSIAGFFNNQHYIGKVIWAHRATVRTIENGDVVVRRPRADDYMVFDGKHEPLIDMELWNRVQAIKSLYPPVKKGRDVKSPYAGMMYCKKCGRAIKRQTYTTGEIRYVCINQRACKTASCTDIEMRDAVAKLLSDSLEAFEVQLEQMEEKNKAAAMRQDILSSLKQRLEDLYALEAAQWNEKAKGAMPDRVFERLNAEVVSEIESIQKSIAESEANPPEPCDIAERIVAFQTALDLLMDDTAPAKEKNALLKMCFSRIWYSRKQKDAEYGRRWGQSYPISLLAELKV